MKITRRSFVWLCSAFVAAVSLPFRAIGSPLKMSALEAFRPTKEQEQFFLDIETADIAKQVIVAKRGEARNGKTTCGAVAVASMLLDQPVIFADGSKHHMRREHARGRPVVVWAIGYDWHSQLASIQRVLFKFLPVLHGVVYQHRGDKKECVLACQVSSTARIEFYSSCERMPCGDPTDMIWIDELLYDSNVVDELLCRLIDMRGTLVLTYHTGPRERSS